MECDGADHPLCRAGDLLVSIDKREIENVCVCVWLLRFVVASIL